MIQSPLITITRFFFQLSFCSVELPSGFSQYFARPWRRVYKIICKCFFLFIHLRRVHWWKIRCSLALVDDFFVNIAYTYFRPFFILPQPSFDCFCMFCIYFLPFFTSIVCVGLFFSIFRTRPFSFSFRTVARRVRFVAPILQILIKRNSFFPSRHALQWRIRNATFLLSNFLRQANKDFNLRPPLLLLPRKKKL